MRWVCLGFAILSAGCSTGKERLEAAGATVTENAVNREGLVVDARNVAVPADAPLGAVLDAAESAEYVYAVSIEGQTVDCDALKRLAALPDLRGLTLRNTDTPAGCLDALIGEGRLQSFAVEGMPYTTDELRWLGKAWQLRTVAVPGTRVDDGFGEVLRRVLAVERVIVSDTAVGDAFVAKLAEHVHLKQLVLDRTNVTGAGLMALAENASVERVHAAHLRPDDVMDYINAAKGLKQIVLDVTAVEAQSATQRNTNGVRVLTPEAGATIRL